MKLEEIPTHRYPWLHKLASAHRTTAGVLLNTLGLFVVLNLVLWAAYAWHDRKLQENSLLKHSKDWLDAAFPGWSPADLKVMLDEHVAEWLTYDDYVMFKEIPVRGRYLNVSEHGFRLSQQQGPWPPAATNFNVFVFGGSTMFGSGVPDNQTVASFLQTILSRGLGTNVCVYNFGTGFYYSTQERLRFERLLGKGLVPQAAVFVDGLNDFIQPDDTPAFRQRFVDAFEMANQKRSLLPALIQELPIARLARSIRYRTQPPVRPDPGSLPTLASQVIETYRQNKKMVEALCAAHGIAPVFVWQPIPRYKYDLKYFPWYATLPNHTHEVHAVGYVQMQALFDRDMLGTNFLWCADLQANERECLYLDIHHYTAKFSEKFADAIGRMSFEKGLLKRGPSSRQPAATRSSRGSAAREVFQKRWRRTHPAESGVADLESLALGRTVLRIDGVVVGCAAVMASPPAAQPEMQQRQRRQPSRPPRRRRVEGIPLARRVRAQIHVAPGFGEDAQEFR